MAGRQRLYHTITSIRGRDGSTPAESSIPEHRAKECYNTDFYLAPIGRKRSGATALALTAATFTGVLSTLMTFQPSNDDTASELWGVDDAATPVVNRLAGGTTWAAPTLKDNITASPSDINSASMNGCLYMTYKSAQPRLHCWNQATVRRVGLPAPVAATVANTGAGAYAATPRTYKIAWVVESGGVIRRGDLSPGVSFTPSGGGTAARITQPAVANEGETSWEVYGAASDGVLYGPIATVAIGTITYDDSTAPASYATNFSPAPYVGQNACQISWKFIISDGNRLIGAGDWDATGGSAAHNRVWFTPVIGTTSAIFQDHERVPDIFGIQQNYIDLTTNNGSYITGLAGPINGVIYVFQNRGIWKLIPTTNDIAPYKAIQLARGSGIGATNQRAIVMAEDETGAAALYFMSARGPYRISSEGLQYLGRDVEDYTATMNLGATKVVCVGLWVPALHQVWFYLATGSANDPNIKLCVDVLLGAVEDNAAVRNGWSVHEGNSCSVRSAVLFAGTVGASMSLALKPYVAYTTGTVILKADTGITDNGNDVLAFVQLPSRYLGGVYQNCAVSDPIIVGGAGSFVLAVTLSDSFGKASRFLGISMAAGGAETRVRRVFEGLTLDDVEAVSLSVGDSAGAPASTNWRVDAIVLPYEPRERLA